MTFKTDILCRGGINTDLANPFRVLRQEELESVQLLRNTFDVVQTIDTNDNLDSTKALL